MTTTTTNALGNLNNIDTIASWVDAVDQETTQKRLETIKDGIKTVIDYIEEPDGSTSKVVATYKIIHKKVPRVVAERKNWKKFGASEKDGPGPNISTTYVADEVEIQFINRFGEEMEEKSGDPLLKGQSTIVHCRFCKSDEHWSVNCPYKDMFNEEEQQETEKTAAGIKAPPMAGRYVPPSQRGGGTGERTTTGTAEHRSDDYTVRITNLPEDSDNLEDELKAMFNRAGRITRFYLARDKSTSRPKGFAFVTFSNAMDAERAIQEFNGAKLEHLILKVEWTKPSN